MPNGLPEIPGMTETPEQKLLNKIRQQPDYQQITIQEYGEETKIPPARKILNVKKHIYQSKSLKKRIDKTRVWTPIRKENGEIVKYNHQGSELKIRTEIFEVE